MPIKGSILEIQMGKRPTNSPLPSPKPLPSVASPRSPLVDLVKKANELVRNLSNPATSQDSKQSEKESELPNSRSCPASSPLKTMLSSSNSRSMMVRHCQGGGDR